MGELSLQPLDVAIESWSNKLHGQHPAQRNIKTKGLYWRKFHQLNTFYRLDLL
jgi:hypothetical protein